MIRRTPKIQRSAGLVLIESVLIVGLAAAIALAGLSCLALILLGITLELCFVISTVLFAASATHLSLPYLGVISFHASSAVLGIACVLSALCALSGLYCIRATLAECRRILQPQRRPGSLSPAL